MFWYKFPKLYKLFAIIAPFKYRLAIVLFVSILVAVSESVGLSLAMPFLGVIVGEESSGRITAIINPIINLLPGVNPLVAICLLLTTIILVKSTLMIFHAYLANSFSFRLGELWHNTIMDRYVNASYEYLINQKQGVLLHNLLAEPTYASKSLLTLIQLFAKSILCLSLYVTLLLVNWKLALILTVISAVCLLVIAGFTKRYASKRGVTKIRLSQSRHSIATESITGIQLVKTYSLQQLKQKTFEHKNSKLRKLMVQLKTATRLPIAAGEIFAVLVFIFLLYFLTSFEQNKLRSMLPLFATMLLISQHLFNNLSNLVTRRMDVHYRLPSLSLIYDLTKQNVEQEQLDLGLDFKKLEEDIQFRNLSFSYNHGTPVLQKLNISIPKGKMTAIVGPSGIGKSTITNLLLGFVKPTGGEILVNGRVLGDYSLRSWRGKLGFVSQDLLLFNTSVKENIRMGKLDASDKAIELAAKQAAIHNFIISLPDGYDTEVGDRGIKLSGGQRQRLAIARAIIRNPEIYIFDEATSALDNESEKLVQASIEELGKEKTVVVIAHRLSTIEKADVVYNLEKHNKSGISPNVSES